MYGLLCEEAHCLVCCVKRGSLPALLLPTGPPVAGLLGTTGTSTSWLSGGAGLGAPSGLLGGATGKFISSPCACVRVRL